MYPPIETSKAAVLIWDGHTLQVAVVADGLEVAADYEEVGGSAEGGINGVERAMAAALYSNL